MNKESLIQYRRLLELRFDLDQREEGTINEMLSFFDKGVKDIQAGLKRTKSIKTKADMRKLLKELEKAHSALIALIKVPLTGGISEISEKAFEEIANILSWDKKDKNFNIPLDNTKKVLNAIDTVPIGGLLLNDWVERIFDDTLSIQKQMLTGNLLGEGYRKLYNRLASVYPDRTRKELITLARTYNQSVVVSAQERLYEENKDIVKKVRWSSILETGFSKSGRGTCARCASLDGNEYEHDARKPNCPLHPRCRCMWLPVTVTWNELFEKHNIVDKDGNPLTIDEMEDEYQPFLDRKETNIDLGRGKGNINSAEWTDKDYGDYISTKSEATIAQVVGPNRARLIKEGKIKFDDLVDRETGELRTLKELGYPMKVKPTVKKGVGSSVPPAVTAKGKISLDGVAIINGNQKDYEQLLSGLPDDQKKIVEGYNKPKRIRKEAPETGYYMQTQELLVADPARNGGVVFIHEYGHHIDKVGGDKFFNGFYLSPNVVHFRDSFDLDAKKLGVIPSDSLQGMSVATKAERVLKQTARDSFYENLDKTLKGIEAELYEPYFINGLKSKRLKDKAMACYTDIVDAMTNGDFREYWNVHGHGQKYYGVTANKYLETFANLFAARAYPSAWKRIKKDFPSLVKSFEQILKELADGI